MDAFAAIAAFFNFSATPAGQQAWTDFRSIDAAFAGKVKDLFDHLHGQVSRSDTAKPDTAKPDTAKPDTAK